MRNKFAICSIIQLVHAFYISKLLRLRYKLYAVYKVFIPYNLLYKKINIVNTKAKASFLNSYKKCKMMNVSKNKKGNSALVLHSLLT